MNRYAIVVTADMKLLNGVHAILNSLKYYENKVDVYLVYWGVAGDSFHAWIDDCKEWFNDDQNYLVSHSMIDIAKEHPVPSKNAVYYLKFYRHWYVAEHLMEYEAVAIFDADMCIVNNIMPYFEIARQTSKIIVPNNSSIYSQQIDNYSETAFIHAYSPPLYSMPIFYDPVIYSKHFCQIPDVGLAIGKGEMVTINLIMSNAGLYDQVIMQPNCLWVQTRWQDFTIKPEYGNKRYWEIAGDRLMSIHGRWWLKATQEHYRQQGKSTAQGNHNVGQFIDIYEFFNNSCFNKLVLGISPV